MKVYTHIQKGEAHPVFCEDFLMTKKDLSSRFLVASVMDGCSGGKETHFSSTLIAKSLRKTLQGLETNNWFLGGDAEQLSKILIQSVRDDLLKTREYFHLITEELVSTIILLVYDSQKDFAHFTLVGDGSIAINNEIHRVEQQNMPNYLAYHLKKDFEDFYKKLTCFQIQSPKNLAISTDGIDSFFDHKLQTSPIDTAKELLVNELEERKDILASRIQYFYEQYNQIAQDDLAIVRIVLQKG